MPRIAIGAGTIAASDQSGTASRIACSMGCTRSPAWCSACSICKLNAVDPLAWTTEVLEELVNSWPASKIDELMPWAYAKKPS
jgi:hypothetical protein